MLRDEAVLNMVLRIFLRVIAQNLRAHSPGAANVDKTALHFGAVAFIHGFGSSLNAHVHFLWCVVDGAFKEVAASINADGLRRARFKFGQILQASRSGSAKGNAISMMELVKYFS